MPLKSGFLEIDIGPYFAIILAGERDYSFKVCHRLRYDWSDTIFSCQDWLNLIICKRRRQVLKRGSAEDLEVRILKISSLLFYYEAIMYF